MMQIKRLDNCEDEVIEIDSEATSNDFVATTEFSNDDRSSVVVASEKNIIHDNKCSIVRENEAKSSGYVDLLSDREKN